MPHKSNQVVLTALHRAVTAPAGLPLFGKRGTPGLFTNIATAKLAAQNCLDNDLLQRVPINSNGKSVLEKYTISEKGLSLLLADVRRHANASLGASLITLLERWHGENQMQDCPLPELFRQTQKMHAALTPGQFHDALREHHEHGRIYLHPWTGPLYDLPEPTYALLSGHEVVYYASLKTPAISSQQSAASTAATDY